VQYLEFEKSIAELESKIESLRNIASSEIDITSEIAKLSAKAEKQLRSVYENLEPWQKVQVSRHPERPHFSTYLKELITDFVPLAGDRLCGEDEAIIGGIGKFEDIPCIVIGQEKGSDTASRIRHNFGMAKPEGYRKAIRLMQMANNFKLPILTFIDTSGAFPGKESEERGVAEAIAQCLSKSTELEVPILATVIGEGGSGGAIALGVGNTILMLENAIYSIISPEGCSSILWKDADHARDAAQALNLTAQNLKKLGVIDDIIPEPLGGAHRNIKETISNLRPILLKYLKENLKLHASELKLARREKFLKMTRQA
jgi:acetyl-CoA carboxylase carboxyl transferase subunit alpha